ncbi:MAG: DUF5011 domain-containing protein, partial [Candidatus Parcubacteria bacterium]|nr:DUF5011 domain-containing protein [Candidatus Parcubacteria bacterium]
KFTSSGTFTAVSSGVGSSTNPVITLTGSTLININVGDSWSELGYSATDAEDGNLTASTTITGTVDTSTVGTYQLKYNVIDSSGTPAAGVMRTVIVHQKYTTLQNLVYVYDPNGNITQIGDMSTTPAGKTVTYSYDDLNRLISATASVASSSPYTYTYSYSPIGNISSSTPGGAYTYAGTNYANPHAATQIGLSTQSYDNNGNLTSDGTWTNSWNYKNQLTQSVKANGTATSTYLYDENGNRVKLTENGITTYFPNKYFNQIGTTGTTTKHIKHIFAGDLLVATIEKVGSATSTVHYVHTDHLGGTNAVTDQNGNLQETLDFMPFGATRIDDKTGGYSEKRQFAGTEHDSLNSLNFMQARYQNPVQGRFISQDPVFWEVGQTKEGKDVLFNPQALNSYSYANNNPVVWKDANGRIIPVIVAGVLLATIVGGLALSTYGAYTGNSEMITSGFALTEIGTIGGSGFVSSGGTNALTGVKNEPVSPKTTSLSQPNTKADYSSIGSTGKIGENELKSLGGQSQVYFKTSQGTRVVDQLVGGVAHESKVGYTSLTTRTSTQISKDQCLMTSGAVKGVTWNFYTSPVTGQKGPSTPLQTALTRAGISVNVSSDK